MEEGRIRFDKDYWNLDGLKERPLKTKGRVLSVELNDNHGPVKRVGVLDEQPGELHLLALRPQALTAHGVTLTSPKNVVVEPDDATVLRVTKWEKGKYVEKEWKKGEYIDMAAQGMYLCLLNLKEKKVELFTYRGSLQPLGDPFPVDPAVLGPDSRVAMTLTEVGGLLKPTVAYVVSGAKSLVNVITLAGPQEGAGPIEVRVPEGPERLGREVHVTTDAVRRSLVVSDTQHHRLVEVRLDGGGAGVICGTGRPGDGGDGEPALSAPINSPKGLAVYRHRQVIDRDFIASDVLLNLDPRGVLPRAVLFADSANSCVRKLLEFPTLAELGGLPEEPTLYTLMGQRKPSPKWHKKFTGGAARGAAAQEADLREYAIPAPVDTAVSRRGELLVGCESKLFLLRPATSLGEPSVQQAGRAALVDSSS